MDSVEASVFPLTISIPFLPPPERDSQNFFSPSPLSSSLWLSYLLFPCIPYVSNDVY